jgi:curved DNA-binding protein
MDYYNILGVSRSANDSDLKKAFKKKSMEHHPDRGGDEEKFKQINEAYQALKDPQKRQMYDQFGTVDPQRQPQGGPGFQNFHFTADGFQGNININDIMNQFGFGGFGQRQMANQDITIGCKITLAEVYRGKNVIATYRLNNGQEQTVDIKVPPGINPGDKIKYAGMGQRDINGIPPGDLYVQIAVTGDKDWQVNGNDILTEKKVNVLDLMTGTILTITTPEGRNIKLTLPKGTQPNTVFNITNKGLPNRRTGQQGNVHVRIIGTVPKNLDNDDVSAIEQIRRKN